MVFIHSNNQIAKILFVGCIISLLSILTLQLDHKDIQIYLDKSAPFIGVDTPQKMNIDGDGIIIAVIDTGVDHNHPDLFGWGSEGKVIDGFNFINQDELPIDTNGHGTQVAGVIAANGQITGIAPKAKILAYKVSEDGEGVSSDLIIKAIDRAISDGADIINISLGVNKTNTNIDHAVDRALDQGILVVVAAGNDGPNQSSIGSPGRNQGAITVGATYNNLTSSLVATLDIDDTQYTVIPMLGSSKIDTPIHSEIVDGGYARVGDLENLDAKGKIIIAERGGLDDEILYFSTKERNSADVGAVALIVYNNESGIFLGELIHEFVDENYSPRIPVVSIDRRDGLEIINKLREIDKGILHLFYNPDFVTHFSSRGPVSPFYIKPDLVAPGAYINTTQSNAGYNFTSGTSYAAPHVSGAAALLMQNNPNIDHADIKSLLLTTAKPVADAYGNKFSVSDSGTGRLDIASAFDAELIIHPPNLVINLSSFEPTIQKKLQLKPLNDPIDKIDIVFNDPEFVKFAHNLQDDIISITIEIVGDNYGDHEAEIIIKHKEIDYTIPVIIHYTEGMINTKLENNKLIFDINHPKEWNFVKISATNSQNGKIQTTTTTENHASMNIYENANYWIEANIRIGEKSDKVFDSIMVDSILESNNFIVDIPEKQIGIISGIVLIIGVTGLIIRKIR